MFDPMSICTLFIVYHNLQIHVIRYIKVKERCGKLIHFCNRFFFVNVSLGNQKRLFCTDGIYIVKCNVRLLKYLFLFKGKDLPVACDLKTNAFE